VDLQDGRALVLRPGEKGAEFCPAQTLVQGGKLLLERLENILRRLLMGQFEPFLEIPARLEQFLELAE
jgi:hypothetical protein